jgi:hypothetical protein
MLVCKFHKVRLAHDQMHKVCFKWNFHYDRKKEDISTKLKKMNPYLTSTHCVAHRHALGLVGASMKLLMFVKFIRSLIKSCVVFLQIV